MKKFCYICWEKVDIKSKKKKKKKKKKRGNSIEFIKIKGRNLKSQETHP